MKRNFLDQVKARMPFKGFNVKPFQELIEAMIDDFKLLQWDTNYASGVNYHDPYQRCPNCHRFTIDLPQIHRIIYI